MQIYFTNSKKYYINEQIPQSTYIKIFYKHMEITWVKDSFSMYEINILSKEILKQTTNTLYSQEKQQFYCKNAKDIDIIYEILDKYKEYIYQSPLPDFNIMEQSIMNFVLNKTPEWIDYN